MKLYNVTIIGDITVEAENEEEAKREVFFDACFDSYRIFSVECLDDEDE